MISQALMIEMPDQRRGDSLTVITYELRLDMHSVTQGGGGKCRFLKLKGGGGGGLFFS